MKTNSTKRNIIIGEQEIKKAMETLEKYKQGKSNLEKRIVENEEWFKMQHWEMLRKKKPSEIEPASAWLFNSIINKHADMMDNFPEALILPRERSDEKTAEVLSAVIPVIMEQNDYEQIYSDCGWYKLKTGTSVQGVFWDNSKRNGFGDVTVKKCDILNLFWEPGCIDIQDSKNVFYVTLEDNETLEEQYPVLMDTNASYPDINVTEYRYDDSIDTTGKSAVIDWYYKKTVRETDVDGIPRIRTIMHYCKFCNGKVLYASENNPELRYAGFYEHGKYPFVVDVTFPEEGMLCGFGYVDIMKDTQAYIDKMQQAILQNALANAKPRAIFNDGAGINEQEFADTNKAIVHASGNLGENAFRPLQVGTLNSVYVGVLNNKIEELKDTSGNTAASQGQASSVTSASGIVQLQEAAGKLMRDANKSTYRAFKRVIELVIELMRQFYTEERCFRIIGEDGKPDFVELDNTGMRQQPPEQVLGIDLGSRMPIFDVSVRTAKKSAYSREAQNNLALSFYQAGFFAPTNADATLACMSMMEFDGKEKAMDMVKNNQTLLQQVMQLQQQVMQLSAILDAQNGTNLVQQAEGQAGETIQAQSGANIKKGSAGIRTGNGSLSKQAATAARNVTAPQ